MTTFEDAKVGDRVWHIRFGWQNITSIAHNSSYPIVIGCYTFTLEGKSETKDFNPVLFWDEIKIEIPPKPLPELKVDDKVLVWASLNEEPMKRYFSHFEEDGNINVFANGTTSWNYKVIVTYNYWELAGDDNCK